MKISKEEKRHLLLSAFNSLKRNFSANADVFSDLLGQMARLDPDKALEMWKQLIKENQDIYFDSRELTSYIPSELRINGIDNIYVIVAKDDFLRTSLYSQATELEGFLMAGIAVLVATGELEAANAELELVESNTRKRESLYKILDSVFQGGYLSLVQRREERLALFKYWANRLPSETERTSLLESKLPH